MALSVRLAFLSVIGLIIFLASASLYRNQFPREIGIRQPPATAIAQSQSPRSAINYAFPQEVSPPQPSAVSIPTLSVLLPAWEVLVIASPEMTLSLDAGMDRYACIFANRETSLAKPAGIVPLTDRRTFKCVLPNRVRRRLPFFQPILARSPGNFPPRRESPWPELMRWNFLVYETFTTQNDVILFAKGLNRRQGINRAPSELACVFGDDAMNGVKTAVTISSQEVFRCERPASTAGDDQAPIKISLHVTREKRAVPSVAYYWPGPKIAIPEPKSFLCACTLVYNVAKYIKEWVVYHSEIGVDDFILYNNDSEDGLDMVVQELARQGYKVRTLFWVWPKTQEAGFSHCAMYARDRCTWMMFLDVDEFVYSTSWFTSNLSRPSHAMLRSLLPKSKSRRAKIKIGQVMINCYEFGPSNQKVHPVQGVTQGYNCRRRSDNRHKSIVLLEAIHQSLLNVVHHFQLKEEYRGKKVSIRKVVVNHYKYQAWPEFKAKFRRRVSAYVADWTQAVNPASKDRTPGLGLTPVEPKGWANKFCEVYDNRLKELTGRWFGVESPSGYKMSWQA